MTINNILGSIIIAALIGASLYLEYGPWPASAEQKARMMEVDRELSTEAANAVFSRECRYKEAIDNAAVEKVVNKIKGGIEIRRDVVVSLLRYDCSNGVSYWNLYNAPGAAFVEDYQEQIKVQKERAGTSSEKGYGANSDR